MFKIWFRNLFKTDINIETFSKMNNEQEADTMLTDWIDKIKNEGIEKGIEKGINQEKIQNAKKMKRDGLDTKDIAKYTGLSLEDIEKL